MRKVSDETYMGASTKDAETYNAFLSEVHWPAFEVFWQQERGIAHNDEDPSTLIALYVKSSLLRQFIRRTPRFHHFKGKWYFYTLSLPDPTEIDLFELSDEEVGEALARSASSKKEPPKMTGAELMACVGSFLLTPLAILIAYLNYDVLQHDFPLAMQQFSKWPWFRGSIILWVIAYLAIYVAFLISDGDLKAFNTAIREYGLYVPWFLFMLLYPGTYQLGVSSDSRMASAVILFVVAHNVLLRIMAKPFRRGLERTG